jgi:hypothetical protein
MSRLSTLSPTAKAALGLAVLVAAAVAFWLIRPLFVSTVVDEAFPEAADGSTAQGASESEADLPLSAGAVVPDGMTAEEVEAEMAAAAAAPPTEAEEPMPAEGPTALLAGTFQGADSRHSGSGQATVYDLGDGTRVLRFEQFEVTNGPDLRVYLAPVGADGTPDVGAGTELGRLKGNIGNQNYDVPADLDLTQPLAVVIYCQPFSVVFATATLA